MDGLFMPAFLVMSGWEGIFSGEKVQQGCHNCFFVVLTYISFHLMTCFPLRHIADTQAALKLLLNPRKIGGYQKNTS